MVPCALPQLAPPVEFPLRSPPPPSSSRQPCTMRDSAGDNVGAVPCRSWHASFISPRWIPVAGLFTGSRQRLQDSFRRFGVLWIHRRPVRWPPCSLSCSHSLVFLSLHPPPVCQPFSLKSITHSLPGGRVVPCFRHSLNLFAFSRSFARFSTIDTQRILFQQVFLKSLAFDIARRATLHSLRTHTIGPLD